MAIFLFEITEGIRTAKYGWEGQYILALGIERLMSKLDEKKVEGGQEWLFKNEEVCGSCEGAENRILKNFDWIY